MHLDHLPRTGALMQAVDVLGDDSTHEPAPLELGEREMAGVRLGLRERLEPKRVELPHLPRVAPKRVDRCVLHRVVLSPDPGRRAKIRDAALGRDPSAGQHHARLARADQLCEPCGVVLAYESHGKWARLQR